MIRSYVHEVKRRLSRRVQAGLERSAAFYAARAKEGVDRPYPPASEPGENLARRSGIGRDAMDFWPTASGRWRSGPVNDGFPEGFNYMAHWQKTTHRRRPWMLNVFWKYVLGIGQNFITGFKGGFGRG